MRKLFIAAAAAVCLPLTLVGQDAAQIIKEYSKPMASQEIPLTIIHLNSKTVPVIFQPPMLFQIRARAAQQAMFYVQTTVEVNGELDTTSFVLEQGGENTPGTPTNITNFTKGTVRLRVGDKVDGILTFDTKLDLTRPFTIKLGLDKADFRFTDAQVQALAPAPAPPAQ